MKYKKQSTVINTCYCKINFIQHIAFSVFSTLYCFTEWGTISNNSVHKLLKLNHKLIQTILLTCLNNSNFQKSDSFWQSPLLKNSQENSFAFWQHRLIGKTCHYLHFSKSPKNIHAIHCSYQLKWTLLTVT